MTFQNWTDRPDTGQNVVFVQRPQNSPKKLSVDCWKLSMAGMTGINVAVCAQFMYDKTSPVLSLLCVLSSILQKKKKKKQR